MVLACILIYCKPGFAEDIVKAVREMKGVKRVFKVLGSCDVVAEYETKTLEKLGITVYEIAKLPGVISTETLVETIL
ncbi:MAG: Lrp/AsnC ligand binding domain-containing protein [Candidatus Methanomethyliaceae archaeon]|nr:Lrp/AsnC ligand binding domain-containing protein [Candidatus Methanomethyliaceae archaeon]MCX8169523.1 Lrp/AsnC ligand binding domain-containing protein [Candidatus Methanomethyliaceae archaeon]MDW7971232.1 Lrp/AsnC ligand binding domain-containing protein [Nitrososphaerota archaeon]